MPEPPLNESPDTPDSAASGENRETPTAARRRAPRRTRSQLPLTVDSKPLRPEENTIKPSARWRARVAAETDPATPRQPRPSAAPEPEAPSGRPHAAAVDTSTVPEAVRDRFVQNRRRYHFPDGALAFTDRGRRLTTLSENTEVIHSLVQIAQARGWEEITVRGTERFRQEAWRQAHLAGLQVRGYRPTEAERAQLVRAIARNREQSSEDVSPPASGAPSPTSDPSAAATPVRSIPEAERSPPDRRAQRILGTLIDHGKDTYQFDPHAEMSYFVRLQTAQGKRTIWGKDLERALNESLSRPQLGDDVALVHTGTDPVTVKRRERDPDGKLLDEKKVPAHRNRWVIEKQEFLQSRADAAQFVRDPSLDPKRVSRDHPELAGTLLAVRAAQIAARRFSDPQEQQRFVNIVRAALADSVERGDPLTPVRLRERTPAREPQREPVR